jgi:hypothetical protein
MSFSAVWIAQEELMGMGSAVALVGGAVATRWEDIITSCQRLSTVWEMPVFLKRSTLKGISSLTTVSMVVNCASQPGSEIVGEVVYGQTLSSLDSVLKELLLVERCLDAIVRIDDEAFQQELPRLQRLEETVVKMQIWDALLQVVEEEIDGVRDVLELVHLLEENVLGAALSWSKIWKKNLKLGRKTECP